jgi:16S rRNA (cytosine967-C5)-methyltransferase
MNPEPGAALRAEAARVIDAVLTGRRSLKPVLAQAHRGMADPRDRALLEAICFQALRHRRRYEFVLSNWLDKPLGERDARVHALLLCGLAQLDALQLPAHAAVAATVAATRLLGREPLVGLVNAILRRAGREALPASEDVGIASSHPDWLVEQLRRDWPTRWPAILEADNAPAPLWLRINTLRAGTTEMLAAIRDAGVRAESGAPLSKALRLPDSVAVESLPGWSAGKLSVQDGAAQLAVEALAPKPGERVLDACAAPGGKTAQLAECLAGSGELLAIDINAARLPAIAQNLQRLGLEGPNLQLRHGDAGDLIGWWDGRGFDAILLDAPCSATGIIRRQPDIKWHRQASDIAALCALQSRLLDALWTALRPGGRLLYSTCSVLKDENERQVEAFLARTAEARPVPLDDRYGAFSGHGRQRFPGQDGMDGFYYALLTKAG